MQVSKYDVSSLTNGYLFFAVLSAVLLRLTGCTAEINLNETLTIKQTEANWHGEI